MSIDDTDAALLRDYSATRSERAFRSIVARYGTMVFGICHRVLGGRQDAEDAVQAVFLALACKAKSVRGKGSLAAWLHRVAVHAAFRIARESRVRREREREACAMAASSIQPDGGDRERFWTVLRPLLDREIDRLPEKYRLPVVLHHLRGLTQEQTAEALGCKCGTVSMRLHRARALLRDRLSRRDVVLSAGLLSSYMTDHFLAASPLPGGVAASAAKFATLSAAGGTVVAEAAGAGLVSAQAAVVTKGVLTAMSMAKLKAVAVVVVAACATAGGGGALIRNSVAGEGGNPDAEKPRDSGAKPGGGVVVVETAGVNKTLDAKLTNEQEERLKRLNSWFKDEIDRYERPDAHSGEKGSGESAGYIETHKSALKTLGVEVTWNHKKRLYEVLRVVKKPVGGQPDGKHKKPPSKDAVDAAHSKAVMAAAKKVGAMPIMKPGTFPERHRAAIRACARELKADGERPLEFYASVEDEKVARKLVIHLWHRSAFRKENQGVRGNPGGKCRDFIFDLTKNRVTEKGFWQ